jgi:surfactin family lipopeptide synthetase A
MGKAPTTMNGNDGMPNTTGLSETKRALLEKYLRGDHTQTVTASGIIPRRSPGSAAPLSFGQQQLWLLAQMMPDIPVYNESVTIHLPGPLDVAALQQSFNEIIRRHEAWRTSFPIVDGQPVQMIQPPPALTLPAVDLRDLPLARREAEARRLATEKALPLFDLAHGPLLRATLIRLNDEDHRLFLTLHHIIFDGTIYEIFLPELYALYEAFSHGKPSPLPELPIQYADFALWQREWLQGQVLADQLKYWKQQLAGAPTALELPTDHPRPPTQTHHGSRYPFALSKRLTDALKTLSRREGVTLYMVLAATFQTLLYRYTGQDDILIGTTTGGRKSSEAQKLIGFFLNTLVLRTNLSGNPTFRDLLGRVREVVLEAHAHQDLPFEYLVKELQPERNLGQNPLIQVMLSLEPPLPVLPSGWTMTLTDVKTNTSKFDLSLELDDRPEGLVGWFEYSTDLFNESTITRMLGHWQILLESIVVDPEQHLAELPLLTEAERQQLLVEWNATSTAYPRDMCVHQLFEGQVERTPDALALVFEDVELTYRELNARANRLARYLRQLGVGPEVLVALCMERSLEMVVGLLGILKAGGAYVPLDPTYPSERLSFMLEDARVSVLLTQQRLATQLPTHGVNVVCLDADVTELMQQSDANPIPMAASDNLAYVIYTSGSTGRPKGVQILHRAVVNFLMSMCQQPGLTAEDTLLAVTTLSFDIAALELFLPLIVGACLILADHDLAADGAALAERLTRSRVTVMQATPVTWRILLAAGWRGNQQLKILCGGEALPLDLAQQLLPKAASLWNMYGPTETTIWSSVCKIEPGGKSVSIGHPIANTQMYLLDADSQLVPVGVPGELYIGGDGLARGYLNRPELTAERFIPDPFSNKPGARLYKTGDLARYRSDGTIELIGRLDYQVKIRGFRIELGEIEEVLRRYPEVQEAVVVARGDTPAEKHLVAYIVTAHGEAPSMKNLRSFLQEKLPGYMLPSAIVLLDALPLTPNGKVDRRALPAPEPDRRTAGETLVSPTLTVHYQLISIWEELLNTRPIGIRDNFFYLGGHSLLAARLVASIEQVFGKKLPLATLFAGPTIEQLVGALQQQEDIGPHSRSPLVAVQPGGSRRPFFFLHGGYKGGAFYCFPLARDLGADQAFYVLEPYRFDGLANPPTLEAMAAAHITAMRTAQPKGPYLLGGFCNGGLVAYEMARQLHAEGETVDLLVLMNPHPVTYLRWMRRMVNRFGFLIRLDRRKQLYWFLWLQHMFRYLLHMYRYVKYPHYRRLKTELDHEQVNADGGPSSAVLGLKELFELKYGQSTERLATDGQVEPGDRRGQSLFALPRLDSIFPDPIFPPDEVLRQDYLGVFYWVASDYRPGLYSGKSTFFFSSDLQELGNDPEWRKVAEAKEVEIHIIAGTHETCKTEYLHDLTEHLSLCLSRAQATKSSNQDS